MDNEFMVGTGEDNIYYVSVSALYRIRSPTHLPKADVQLSTGRCIASRSNTRSHGHTVKDTAGGRGRDARTQGRGVPGNCRKRT